MLIDYDHNPAASTDEKLRSLVESIQLSLAEIASELASLSSKHSKDNTKASEQIERLTNAVGTISSQIQTIQGQITTLNSRTTLRGKQFTLNGVSFVFRRYGRIVIVVASGTPTQAIPTDSYVGSITIDEEYRPIANTVLYAALPAGETMQINMSAAGEFKYGFASAVIPTTRNVYHTFSYITGA